MKQSTKHKVDLSSLFSDFIAQEMGTANVPWGRFE